MSKNNYQEDYYKSLNKIMILGLTGMAALGTSMLFIESTKTNASPLFKVGKFLSFSNKFSTIKKAPALIPKKANIVTTNSSNKLKLNKQLSRGYLLSEIDKKYLNPKPKLKPIIVRTQNIKQLIPKK